VVFVGAVDPTRLAALIDIGAAAVGRRDAFEIALERTGGTSAGVAWITPERDPPRPLVELHARIRQRMQEAAFRVEARGFRPHVTLARRCLRSPPRRVVASIRWRAAAVALVESQPQRGGSIYRDLATWRLAG